MVKVMQARAREALLESEAELGSNRDEFLTVCMFDVSV